MKPARPQTSRSAMDAEERARLAAAYCRTAYRIRVGGGSFDLRIGQPWALPEAAGAGNGFAYLTAVNPGSHRLDDDDNASRQAALYAELSAAGFAPLPGVAVADDGAWPDEPGWLVSGLGADAALSLARAYGQNAFLVGRPGRAVEMLWCDVTNSANGDRAAG